MKGDNGELLVSEEQVSDRWREYFEKLLNEENEWNDELSAEYVEGPADMISKRGKTGNTRPKGEESSRTKWCNW